MDKDNNNHDVEITKEKPAIEAGHFDHAETKAPVETTLTAQEQKKLM